MKTYKNIDQYIKDHPKNVQTILQKLRTEIKTTAPKAEEVIKYGIPTYVLHGNLIHFGGYKTHIGLYPGPKTIMKFEKELSKYELSKGTIRFPIDQPLPFTLIKKIVRYRVKANLEKVKNKK